MEAGRPIQKPTTPPAPPPIRSNGGKGVRTRPPRRPTRVPGGVRPTKKAPRPRPQHKGRAIDGLNVVLPLPPGK